VRTEQPRVQAEDLVTNREPGDRPAGGLDLPGKFAAQDRPPGPAKTREQPPQERAGGTAVAVGPVDRRGPDLDQDLVLYRDRPLHLLDPLDIRRPVPVVHDRSHRLSVPQSPAAGVVRRARRSSTSARPGNSRPSPPARPGPAPAQHRPTAPRQDTPAGSPPRQISLICAARTAMPIQTAGVQNGGSLRGCTKSQVALRDGWPP
jgi:hypothetical protein